MAQPYTGDVVTDGGGGAKPYTGPVIPLGGAPKAAPPKPLDPPDSSLAFINQNVGKGLTAAAGFLPDVGQNILNLMRMGGDAAKRFVVGPQAADPNFQPLHGMPGTSESLQNLLRQGGMLDPRGDPSSKGGEYAAAGIQGLTGAALGGPGTPLRQIPRLLTAGTTSGLGGQAATDLLGPEAAPLGAMIPGKGAFKYKGPGERATEARQTEDYALSRKMGIPPLPRTMKTDEPQQKLQNTANKDLGQPEGAPIDPKTLNNYRAQKWQEYEKLMNAPELKGGLLPNSRFRDSIREIEKEFVTPSKELPETFKPMKEATKILAEYQQGKTFQPKEIVRAIRKLRTDAGTNLSMDKGPEQKQLGQVQKRIAASLEDLIEDNLTKHPELLANYREARTSMAKAFNVEEALDPRTGKIDGGKLAALEQAGTPLSGGLADIARVSRAFPSAVKAPEPEGRMFSKTMSPYGMTHPGAVVAHETTRRLDPMQRTAIYQNLFVDPRNRLNPEMERAIRAFLGAQAGNRAGIPPAP